MGQPQNNQGKQKGEQNEQQSQARDARKELAERNKQSAEKQGEPESGEKSPQDPANRMTKGGKQDESDPDAAKRNDDTPPWFAALPPEIRDAIDAGRGEEIPARYRELVRRYNLWLQKQRKDGRR